MQYDDRRPPESGVFANMLRHIFESHEAIPDAVKFIQKSDLNPASASEAINRVKYKGKEKRPSAKKNSEALFMDVERALKALAIDARSSGVRTASFTKAGQHQLQTKVYVTENNEVVVDTMLEHFDSQLSTTARQLVAIFMNMVNIKIAWLGKLTTDSMGSQVIYRTGIDLQGIEDYFDYQLLQRMLNENHKMSELLFMKTQQVSKEGQPGTVLESIINTN
jgi:hypothetical protein